MSKRLPPSSPIERLMEVRPCARSARQGPRGRPDTHETGAAPRFLGAAPPPIPHGCVRRAGVSTAARSLDQDKGALSPVRVLAVAVLTTFEGQGVFRPLAPTPSEIGLFRLLPGSRIVDERTAP